MKEYFPMIQKVKYEGKNSRNPFSFKYYDAEKIILLAAETHHKPAIPMDIIEYITVGRVAKDKETPREINIYYKLLDKPKERR